MPPRIDRTGQRYGRLVVTAFSHTDKPSRKAVAYWECRCDCGKDTVVLGRSLASGNTRSCGCLGIEALETGRTSHGLTYRNGRKTLTYSAWSDAKARCQNPRNKAYANYGGRGIEFRFDSVLDLIADIGEKPDVPGLSMDRIDNDGHYEAGNVRWTDRHTQNMNRRKRRSGRT